MHLLFVNRTLGIFSLHLLLFEFGKSDSSLVLKVRLVEALNIRDECLHSFLLFLFQLGVLFQAKPKYSVFDA